MSVKSIPTQSLTRRLSDVARHVVIPDGVVTTGWPEVEAQCREMGLSFPEWQAGMGRLALGKRKDGKYAASVGGVVWSIPRQVVKTFLVRAIVFALCILHPGLTVLWTAHRTRTATETFRKLQGFARRSKVAAHVLSVRSANGEQAIEFRNGSRILFGAREQGFGRGFDEVDIIVFDEAQILTDKALEDMVAASNQSRFPAGALLFFMGTPPRPSDPGEAFTYKRTKALAGETKDQVYVEFSADPDGDLDDPKQVLKANPSVPDMTPWESVWRLRENLPDDDSYRREAFGVWDLLLSKTTLPRDSWASAGDASSIPTSRLCLGVEVGPDLVSAAVSLAGQRADEDWHIELDEHKRGTDWLGPYLEALLAVNPTVSGVVGDVGGPLASLLDERRRIRGTSVTITPLKVRDLGGGCAQVLNGIVTQTLHHTDQPQMTTAAMQAGKRRLGDTGMWVWSRASNAADITPIQSATYALWGAQNIKSLKKPTRRGGGRRVVTG